MTPDESERRMRHFRRRQRRLETVVAELRDASLGAEAAAYRASVRRIRKLVRTKTSPDATVVVVSRGDTELLKMRARTGWHFPRLANGDWAGFYPADSTAAIAQVEAAALRGGDYLLFPAPAFWWFEKYPALTRHLERRFRSVHHDDDCVMFALHLPPRFGAIDAIETLTRVVEEFRTRFSREPAILDWGTKLNFEAALPKCPIFCPPTESTTLPYLDETIDVVVSHANDDWLRESRRVASAAIVSIDDAAVAHVEWKANDARTASAVSVLVVVQRVFPTVLACLTRMIDTLPDGTEILVATPEERWDGLRGRPSISLDVIPFVPTSTPGQIWNQLAARASNEALVCATASLLPLPGWLEPLVHLLQERDNVGAVCGKVVDEGGRLHEAGASVYAAGSLGGFGDGDYAPEGPLFEYVREVEICLSAPLATTRQILLNAGGFDEEERCSEKTLADFCLRLNELGRKTLYQPSSTYILIADDVDSPHDDDSHRFQERWRDLSRGRQCPDRPDWISWYDELVAAEGCR